MSAAFNPKDKIRRFHHVALEVSDMAASINFYCDVFGYQLTEQHEASEVPAIPVELAFLRLGENHHDMVLSTDPNKNYRARDDRDDREGPVAIHHGLAVRKPRELAGDDRACQKPWPRNRPRPRGA